MPAGARRWRVGPDHLVPTEAYGDVQAVSKAALEDAVLDGVAMLHRTGGVLTVVVGRELTDLPGEAVTTGAVVEWKPHAAAREEEERRVDVLPQREPINLADDQRAREADAAGEIEREMLLGEPREWTPFDGTPEPGLDEALEEARMAGVAAATKPAVIEDEHGEPEEDISSIPPEKR